MVVVVLVVEVTVVVVVVVLTIHLPRLVNTTPLPVYFTFLPLAPHQHPSLPLGQFFFPFPSLRCQSSFLTPPPSGFFSLLVLLLRRYAPSLAELFFPHFPFLPSHLPVIPLYLGDAPFQLSPYGSFFSFKFLCDAALQPCALRVHLHMILTSLGD